MFSNINTTPLAVVPSVPAILSAAEMLEDQFPDIAGSFIQYATLLCEDYFSKHPSNPEIDRSMKDLQELNASISEISIRSTAKELEQFGDSLIATADITDLPTEMTRLVYLLYGATSIYGKISDKVNKKMQKLEIRLSSSSVPPPTIQPSHQPPQMPVYPKFEDISQTPTVSHSAGINYPSLNDLKMDNHPDISNAKGFHYPNFDLLTSSTTTAQNPNNHNKIKELVQIASVAFKKGSLNVAYAAMTAALTQMESFK